MDHSVTLNAALSATPVVERRFLQMADTGRAVKRLCLVRQDGHFFLWSQVAGVEHPVTVELFRGGVRTWTTLAAAVRWLEKKLPAVKVVEVVLRPS